MQTRSLANRTAAVADDVYTGLSPLDRLRLVMDAHAREDNDEVHALLDATPHRAVRLPDFAFLRLALRAAQLAVSVSYEILRTEAFVSLTGWHTDALRLVNAALTTDSTSDGSAGGGRALKALANLLHLHCADSDASARSRLGGVRAQWDHYTAECEHLGLDPDAVLEFAYPRALPWLHRLRAHPDWSTIEPTADDIALARHVLRLSNDRDDEASDD